MWSLEQMLKCSDCGTRLEEWDRKKGGDRHAYIPQIFSCPGCAGGGDALEAANNQAKVSKAGKHGLKVRLMPKYVVDYQVRNRTPEQRARMLEMDRDRLAMERDAEVDTVVKPIKAVGLGGSRQPPVAAPKTLDNLPPTEPQSADE